MEREREREWEGGTEREGEENRTLLKGHVQNTEVEQTLDEGGDGLLLSPSFLSGG